MNRELTLPYSSIAEGLACPECSAPLDQSSQKLECRACAKCWPVIDGIPHFIENFPYWGEIPLEKMKEVNRAAEMGDWQAPLVNSSDSQVRRAAEMILNLDRANWHWLIDLPSQSRVLDIGAGMGTNSHALGKYYKSVVAVEPVQERVRFMRQRFAQEQLTNIKVVRSSLWTLPFAKESFDMVAMNGVLEWVAQGTSGDPRKLQEKALNNISSLVRPGGYFYLGIENRYSLGYFVGYPDPHCGLPWVTILPRPLSHWYARRKGQQDGYRNYLYSAAGYKNLLRRAGFTKIACYLALPSYNQPRFLIPLEGDVFNYYARTFLPSQDGTLRKVLRNALLRLNLMKHCEYSFAIVAQK